MNEKVISSEAMKEIGEVYCGAFYHAFDNFSPVVQESLSKWWLSIVAQEKPYLMVTEQGVSRIQMDVFGNKDYTDFLFHFTYVFHTRWAGSQEERQRLIEVVACSLSQSQGSPSLAPPNEYSGIPKEILSRLVSYQDAVGLFLSNSWLLMLVLAPVFMAYGDLIKKPETKGKTKS